MNVVCEISRKPEADGAPRRQRSVGRAALGLASLSGETRIAHVHESGPYRIRLPRHSGPALEAVLLNTAGGIACGDRFECAIDAGPATDCVITTPASERIYRSDGPTSAITAAITVDAAARLAWMPQETILYDNARLARQLDVDMAPDATVTLFETLVFGRVQHGERLRRGHVRDVWRLRRGGRLVFADTLRLDGEIAPLLDRPSVLGGGAACATFVHIAPDAESRLEEARDLLAGAPRGTCGAGAWNGMLVARFVARDGAELRAAAIPLLEGITGRPLPRVWQS